ncbi:nucleoside/nucleotide kinase family protein, partial [Arthrobacter deserti]|nr:nucleoside/nucleotide kinase family protein [Arthrobacter deserti]
HGSTPLVITEGNYLLQDSGAWPRVRACLDEAWFLAPEEPVRHQRLIRRHEYYGKSPDEARNWALGSDQRNAEL